MNASSEITFSVNSATLPKGLGIDVFTGLVVRACQAWANACGAVFREVKNPAPNNHILFQFVPRSGSDSPFMDAFADTRLDESTGSSTISLDINQAWSNPVGGDLGTQGIDMYSVVLHELGHALGIQHGNATSNSDVMHEWYVGKKTELTYRDSLNALRYKPPKTGRFCFGLNKTTLVPLGDYVYLFVKKPHKRKGRHIWEVLRSKDLRVWAQFKDFGSAQDGVVFANRNGRDHLSIGVLGKDLHVDSTEMQWQVPMFDKKPPLVSGVVINPPNTQGKQAIDPTLYAKNIDLVDGPHNYSGQSVWVSGNKYGFTIHTAPLQPTAKLARSAAPAPLVNDLTHLKMGHIGDDAMFVFWRTLDKSTGRPIIRFTHDEYAGLFKHDLASGLVGQVPGASPDGDFAVLAVNDVFYISYLVGDMICTEAMQFSQKGGVQLIPVPEKSAAVRLQLAPGTDGKKAGLRSIFHQGRIYMAISTDDMTHFVEH